MRNLARSAQERAAALQRMVVTGLDVVVVGGGMVGAGVALDGAAPDLSAGIIGARDWASDTSSRSTKLMHGVVLLKPLAPHLVRPGPFLYPLTHRRWGCLYRGAGVLPYDTMSVTACNPLGVARHRHLVRRSSLREAQGMRKSALTGAVKYWDAQVDDAHRTVTLVRTSACHGAPAANRATLIGLLRQRRARHRPNSDGKEPLT